MSRKRARPANEVPLDDGARNGTEHWRDLGGVSFCHWDRWLLRLALDEPDLEARLARIGCGPQDVLDEVERASKWLHDKAFRRIWHAPLRYRTEAMRRTPRNLLEARAREGNWAAFPVSPAPHLTRLRRIYQGLYVDWRCVGSVVLLFRIEVERMLGAATNDDEILAVRRAIIGAAVEAIANADDSGGELGPYFRDEELAYLDHLGAYLERFGILRDLLELATWEDYGLFHHIEVFLTWMPERGADLAICELAQLIAELRAAGLGYQVSKAQRLRQLVLASGGTANAVIGREVGAGASR